MKEIVLDTETTGISVVDGHRIVEIGCIELDELIPTQKKFHCYLNPQRKVSEDALKIHGYNDSMLKDKKIFKDISEEFINFIQGKKYFLKIKELIVMYMIGIQVATSGSKWKRI